MHNLWLLRLWSEAGGVVDVEDFHAGGGDPVEEAEGVADRGGPGDCRARRNCGVPSG